MAFTTAGILYVCDDPAHTVVLPVIAPAVFGYGLTVTIKGRLVKAFPQAFLGVTVTFPLDEPTFTVIAFVFDPEVIVEPAGNAQV